MKPGLVGFMLVCGCGPDATKSEDTGQNDASTSTGPEDTSTSTNASPDDTNTSTSPGDTTSPPLTVRDRARALATRLIGRGDFMVGLGNDNAGPYDQEVPIDLHYAYLVGYGGEGGWPDWNADGNYPLYFANSAAEHNVTPMFTYYQLALELETGGDHKLADAAVMQRYLGDVRLLYEKLAAFGRPAVLGFEPDFFGYLMQRADAGRPPEAFVVAIHVDAAPECADLPETAVGLGRCLVRLARALAPQVAIGFHASMWGAWYDVLDPEADIAASGRKVAEFLRTMSGGDLDFVGIETLDRDAGFWETGGGTAPCSVRDGPRGAVYWDEANLTRPNFRQHLTWVTALTTALERPAMWWQTPLGVPAETCGGENERWRDNRVRYFFSHIDELIAAGGAGMTFGTGAGGQTHLGTDGGQFKRAATAYRAAPAPL